MQEVRRAGRVWSSHGAAMACAHSSCPSNNPTICVSIRGGTVRPAWQPQRAGALCRHGGDVLVDNERTCMVCNMNPPRYPPLTQGKGGTNQRTSPETRFPEGPSTKRGRWRATRPAPEQQRGLPVPLADPQAHLYQ